MSRRERVKPGRMRYFSVEVPVLKVEPLFVLGCSHDRFAALMLKRFKLRVKKEDPDDENVMIGRMYTFNCEPWRVVWTRDVDLPVALHETFHLVTRICSDKGIVIRAHNERGDNDDETAAYLFECLARVVIKRCR